MIKTKMTFVEGRILSSQSEQGRLLSSQSEQFKKYSKISDWLKKSRPSKKATFVFNM